MLVVTVKFVAKPQRLEDFSARVRRQARESLEREPGCHRFDIASDPSDPARIFLYEIYSDQAAFDAHLSTAHFKSFNADTLDWVESKSVERWDGPWA